jgi:hypothetical protein
MNRPLSLLALSGLLSLALACSDKGAGKAEKSYCQALCDWATACAAAERGVDPATLMEECLAAAEAADPSCADYADLDPVSAEGLTACTDAIDEEAAAGVCDPWSGRYDEMETSTTPAECASQGSDAQETFDQVQESVEESNEELCNRFSESFCTKMEECIAEQVNSTGANYEEIVAAVGLEPVDYCLQALEGTTQECVTEGEYEPGESATDVNTQRETARECLADFESVTCEELLAGNMPAACAGAVEDPTAYAGTLYEIGQAYLAE